MEYSNLLRLHCWGPTSLNFTLHLHFVYIDSCNLYRYIMIYICIYLYTWNPNDPCFDWKGPCFEGFGFKNRGHLGSRYIYIYIYMYDLFVYIYSIYKHNVFVFIDDYMHIYIYIHGMKLFLAWVVFYTWWKKHTSLQQRRLLRNTTFQKFSLPVKDESKGWTWTFWCFQAGCGNGLF